MTFPPFLRRSRPQLVLESEPEANGSSGNRRDMFKMLGAGVVGAVGASMLDAGSASADSAVLAGETNTATSTTEITTSSGSGLYGVSVGASGFLEATGATAGVIGDSNTNTGIYGFSSAANGINGFTSSDGGVGVCGEDFSSQSGGVGTSGSSNYGVGVYGVSAEVSGIESSPLAGVVGDSNTNAGVMGLASDSNGVVGITTRNGWGAVFGNDQSSAGGYGVQGWSNNGTGVQGAGSADGYGVQAQGGKAQLCLVPGSTAGHPTSGRHLMGELYMGNTGELWLCTKAGTPGTWKKLTD